MKNKNLHEFNINFIVAVKLTDLGRKILRKQHDELYAGANYIPSYYPPAENADGWGEWQLWDLMNCLGKHCYNGCELTFEPTILIDLEQT